VPEKHEMVLTGHTESGDEEWVCPRCGRRMLLRWPPHFERLVLEHGDATAIHACGKGGVRVNGITAISAATGDVAGADRNWLRDNGMDWDAPPS